MKKSLWPHFKHAIARGVFLMGFVFIAPNNVFAHEYWVEPSEYAPEVGGVVVLETRVGQNFLGDLVPNIEEFYSDYSVLSDQGRSPVLGSLATFPPAYFKVKRSGTYIVGQRTERSFVELEQSKFKKYLITQGLQHIIPALEKRNLSGKNSREYFSRCVKSIITTQNQSKSEESSLELLSTPLGYTLEIIPLTNPVDLKNGGNFNVKILFEGKPLENLQLTATNKLNPENEVVVRSDADGLASLDLSDAGVWMVHGVHMIPIEEEDADWESFWANITFKLGK